MRLVPLWTTGNFRVVLCGGDGPEAGCFLAVASVVTFVAAYRWVLPDSSYGVSDSSDSRS